MRKNKKVFKKATIGASLLMSAVLLCGNTVKAHAQADLTPEESQKLTEFLATQPTNGARTSLGLTNNVSHNGYYAHAIYYTDSSLKVDCFEEDYL